MTLKEEAVCSFSEGCFHPIFGNDAAVKLIQRCKMTQIIELLN